MYSFHSFRYLQNLQFNFPNFWLKSNIMTEINKKTLESKLTSNNSANQNIKLLNKKIETLEYQLGSTLIENKILMGNLERATEELKLSGKIGLGSNYLSEVINNSPADLSFLEQDDFADDFIKSNSDQSNLQSSKIKSLSHSNMMLQNEVNDLNEKNLEMKRKLKENNLSQKTSTHRTSSDKTTNTENTTDDEKTALGDENNILKERVKALASRLKVAVRCYELLKNNSSTSTPLSSSSSVLNLVVRANDDIMDKSSSEIRYDNKELHKAIAIHHQNVNATVPANLENVHDAKRHNMENRRVMGSWENDKQNDEICSGNTKYFVKSLEFEENFKSSFIIGMKNRIAKFENQTNSDDGLVQKIKSKFEK